MRPISARSRRPAWVITSMLSSNRRASSGRSEEHTSELQSLMRISYAVFCLKKKKKKKITRKCNIYIIKNKQKKRKISINKHHNILNTLQLRLNTELERRHHLVITRYTDS